MNKHQLRYLCSILFVLACFVSEVFSITLNDGLIQKIISLILQEDKSIDSTIADVNKDGVVTIIDLVTAIDFQGDIGRQDTLFLDFHTDNVEILNQNVAEIAVTYGEHESDIIVTSTEAVQMVISASGSSPDGRICVNADTSYVLQLNGLNLTSTHAPAFNSLSSKRAIIKMVEGSDNYLTDAEDYELQDPTESANGCLNSMGRIDLIGNGQLTVTGRRKHAIYSKKSIHFDGGSITVNAAESDAVHSGKYVTLANTTLNLHGMKQDGIDTDEYVEMRSGQIDIHLTGDGAKGIKSIDGINLEGGVITATATGNVINKKGDLTYCTIIKTDGDISITNTELNLTHNGEGGKCVSAKKNFTMKESSLHAELTGNGGSYINQDRITDYYTPRAIEADDSLSIISGEVQIHCTGIGSKGIVCHHELTIGEIEGDNDKLQITIVTEGTAVVNNVEEDYREGCPKAFKSNDQLDILSGTIKVSTTGMGGEGFESKNEIWIVGGEITCDTFDDCFNGGTLICVYGGNIYCCSQDNDGFDSNGSIVINGGNIFSASLHAVNESFDTEGNTLIINGGNIIGIGGSEVKPERSVIPYYSYTFWDDQLVQQPMPVISLAEGRYLSIVSDNNNLLSAKIPANFSKAIVTIASPLLSIRREYVTAETDMIQGCTSYNNNLFCIGGITGNNMTEKFKFVPKYY